MSYAKVSDVKAGTILKADAGFSCIDPDEILTVRDINGLCVRCDSGEHYLDGQIKNGEYIGLTIVEVR